MAECIEREVAVKNVMAAKWIEGYDGAMAMEIVAAAPAVDVAPVVHARWEPCFDKNCRCRWGFGKCSNCGQEYYAHAIDHYKYCPICGAKMDGAILGCVLIALGASMIYVPAGVITAGLLLVAGAVLDGYDDTDEEGKDGSE